MRLWPLSRKALPKQFQNVMGGKDTLFQMALKRVSNTEIFFPPLIIGHEDHRFVIKNNCADIHTSPSAIILEPIAKNTASAVVIAGLWAQSVGHAYILVLPSDHIIQDKNIFEMDVTCALNSSNNDDIVYFGIRPTHNHTGYGYITSDLETGKVLSFNEKPDEKKAQFLIDEDHAVWNSGIFLLPVKKLIENAKQLDPEFLDKCKSALEGAKTDLGFLKLSPELCGKIPEKQFDKFYCEKVKEGRTYIANFIWSDIGSWDSVFDQKEKDTYHNVTLGNITQINSSNNLIYSDGTTIGLSDIENTIVIATKDAILIANKQKAQNVKNLVLQLEKHSPKQTNEHFVSYRPWGSFETITVAENFRVLRMKITPGGRLSTQSHRLRSEAWSVISGTLTVTKDAEIRTISAGKTIYAEPNERHMLENKGVDTVEFIEVQTGRIDNNDIERFDRAY